MKSKWFAIYIYYPGNLDLMLQQLIHPFTNRFFKNESDGAYFFIRYWENGSHIRLRMKVDPEKQEMLSAEIRNRVNAFFAQYADPMLHTGPKTESESPGHELTYISYEPEINRYGNQQSMPWAEAHFCSSSVFILDWINSRKDGSSILAQALSIHLMLLAATQWMFPRLLSVCDLFIDGWLPRLYDPAKDAALEKRLWLKQFESAFDRAKSQILPASKHFWESLTGDTAPDKVSRFLQENIKIMKNYSAAGFEEAKLNEIVTSMMHMNNNRLGISNYEEAYGVYCLRRALDHIANS
ncbi:thiopeptide-type bacteriocin biosynthesis protein [Pedobacter caeni]|uniref:Thiopeptide-type bacteriocin biosynthesis domain-containing protein n=1 Tax=Pedobacter caeni TaxID=288992 RepID=A0A1M5HFI1_9SPHI|nr:thiopeptide-type bacteriocin biosynthesis protein [Pedobacter caeni]SHG14703.1 thiopeptide-type bacteriocin biosynthesis domain-containing protein [Pedobacter caeni]